MVAILDNRRAALVDSIGSTGFAVRRLSKITDTVYPQLNEILHREPGFVSHLNSIEPQLAFTGANLPLLLKGLVRTTQEGAFEVQEPCRWINPVCGSVFRNAPSRRTTRRGWAQSPWR
ncbi:Putative Mce family protein [Mycobacteroides abscessus subsp. massiliense]|nr:Putative Mce family protein [Mycobacteroides abscessus subsp. massiliense]